ncbi:MAG: dihydroorotate dehydrogenase [Gemmatimonadota bacterium]
MDLAVDCLGIRFRNPVLLAAGTCGFGEEVASVARLDRVGGLVTKSVTLEPRWGNPAPRVAELRAGMINSVGLANPGARAVLAEKLPWIRDHLADVPVFVSVAGHTPEEFWEVVEILEGGAGFAGFEINLSCPNDTRRDGFPFALDPEAVDKVLRGVRERTARPVLAKLAAHAPVLGPVIRSAESAGANGLTLVNTLPGLAFDLETRSPVLGAGPGGVSGPGLLPVGVHTTWSAARLTSLPLLGVGGISRGEDACQYLLAGASLVQVGTASFWDPRAGGRVASELHRIGRSSGIQSVTEWIGGGLPPVADPPADAQGGAVLDGDGKKVIHES